MLTDIKGLRVGHWTHPNGFTGCTVIIPPEGTVGSCEWRGGATGDREWVLLQPEQRIDRVHALVLSGGSAFGLATADGVMRWCEEQGIGWEVFGGFVRVPIVPAAILFDLRPETTADERPNSTSGRAACEAAFEGEFEVGSVGAGAGCTAGKFFGLEWAVKSGIGTASVTDEDLTVSALVAANPVGDILGEDGQILAGSRAPAGTKPARFSLRENTVLGVVATNASLTKQETNLMAKAGQDGISTVVRPAHTRYDGDVVFGLSTRQIEAPVDQVITLAPQVIASAIRNAVTSAKGVPGFPGLAD
jgi:L-aminopeptidase/D-esterase-like protein